MIEFRLVIPSEILNLLNFIVNDIFMVALVMFLTSKITGMYNARRAFEGHLCDLRVFDVPHVGGGIVTVPGGLRWVLILLRVSAILAVCVSNFGLLGRSETAYRNVPVRIRGPGYMQNFERHTVLRAAELQLRCTKALTADDDLQFGVVMNNTCYQDVRDDALLHLKSLSMQLVNITVSLPKCETIARHSKRFFTVFRCANVEMSCLGPFPEHGQPLVTLESCNSLVFERDFTWYCRGKSFNPYSRLPQTSGGSCRKVGATYKELRYWWRIYRYSTLNVEEALFASAYGVERTQVLPVPDGEQNVTLVNLFWIVPTVWVFSLVVALLAWSAVLRLHDLKPVAHDERFLLSLLEKKSRSNHTAIDGVHIEFG